MPTGAPSEAAPATVGRQGTRSRAGSDAAAGELTGSPLHLGLTGLARAVPILGLSLIGGVIADRVNRRQFISRNGNTLGRFQMGAFYRSH